MRASSPIGLMVLGFGLLLFGVLIPFLMVIDVMQAGFLLAFLSYFASISGLILGLVGTALYARERQR